MSCLKYDHIIYIEKRRLCSPAILFFQHGEKLGGKSAMFGNTLKRTKGRVNKLYWVSLVSDEMCVSVWYIGSVKAPVAACLTHKTIFSPGN